MTIFANRPPQSPHSFLGQMKKGTEWPAGRQEWGPRETEGNGRGDGKVSVVLTHSTNW